MIPSGQTGRIQATLDSEKLHGEVARGMSVFTNDPARPSLRLVLRATILGSVLVFPEQQLAVGNVRATDRSGRLLIRQDPTERGELVISELRTTVSWLSARAERLVERRVLGGGLPPGRAGDWLVTVELDRKAPPGSSNQEVSFRTGLGREPEFAVPVVATVRAPVNMTVQELELRPSVPARVGAVVRRGLDASRLRVQARPTDLQVQVEQSGPRHFEVQVVWNGESPAAGTAELVFEVGEEAVTLPLRLAAGS